MKPAGVFEVKYQPRGRDMFADWIQNGETFHLSEPLRALIARDCYPRFVGANSFSLTDIKSWLQTYLTVHGSSITYFNNRYTLEVAYIDYSFIYLVFCFKVPLSIARP